MLTRCGPYLSRIDFDSIPLSWQLCALLSLAPNIRRLNLDNSDQSQLMTLLDEHLEEIGTVLPRMVSFGVIGYAVSG